MSPIQSTGKLLESPSRCRDLVLLLAVVALALSGGGCGLAYPVAGIVGASGGSSGGQSSAVDQTQPLISGVPGWNGGCYWPDVNLYSGNFFLNYPLIDVPAIGPDWDVRLHYNATLAAISTTVGAGWSLSEHIRLDIGQPNSASITVSWGDGRHDVFVDDGSGWAADASLEGRRITAVAGGYELGDKHGNVHAFDATGLLVALRDRNLNSMTYAYDGLSRLIRMTDASGRTCHFGYDGSNHLVAISGLPAQPILLQYSGNRLASVTDPGGFSTQYQYDGLSRLVRAIDYDGDALDVEYYTGMPVVKQITTGDALRVYTYDAATRATRVTDRLGNGAWSVTAYSFDVEGLCTAVDGGPLGVTQNSYDPLTNHRLSHTDADGHMTSWTYDGLGNRLTMTDALGLTETYGYDPNYNLLVSRVDRNGKTWSWQYDANGNLLVSTNPLGQQGTYTYTPQGLVASYRDPRNFITTVGYDANGNPTSVTDPAGFTQFASYNGRGRPISLQDQIGNTTNIARDGRDAVTSVTLPMGGIYTLVWTGCGKLASVQDPNNATTSFQYDARKGMISRTDAVGATLTLARNGAGRVLRAMDALGRIQEYAYDSADRLIRSIDPEGGTTTHSYSATDLQSTMDAMGNLSIYAYTPRHELATATSPGVTTLYQYDGMSRLVQASLSHAPDPQISLSWGYDDAGRIVSVTQGHLSRTANITVDPAGNPISVNDNLRPNPVSFVHDNRNLCTFVNANLFRADPNYDARGLVSSVVYPATPTRADYLYDGNSRLVNIANQGNAFSASYSLGYDLRGDRLSVAATTPATGILNQSVQYDPVRRPLGESYGAGANTFYNYDLVGNRIQKSKPPAPPDLYSYSPAHRLLSAGTLTQIWNVRGQVVQLTQPGVNMSYSHRGDGALESITRNGQTWQFRVGPLGELACVVLPSGQQLWYAMDFADRGLLRRAVLPGPGLQPIEEYVHIPAGLAGRGVASAPVMALVAPFTPTSSRAMLTGPDGIAQITSNSGVLLSDRYFGLFGDVVASLGGVHSTQGFLGMDSESGLPEPVISNPWGVGGTFDAPLPVRPQFTFARVSGSGTGPWVIDQAVIAVGPEPYSTTTGSSQFDTGFGPDDLFCGPIQEKESVFPAWCPGGKGDKWWLDTPPKPTQAFMDMAFGPGSAALSHWLDDIVTPWVPPLKPPEPDAYELARRLLQSLGLWPGF